MMKKKTHNVNRVDLGTDEWCVSEIEINAPEPVPAGTGVNPIKLKPRHANSVRV